MERLPVEAIQINNLRVQLSNSGVRQRGVVHPGAKRFPMRHGAQAIDLADLMRLLGDGSGAGSLDAESMEW